MNYVNLTEENVYSQHLCCAISDKKHQGGVAMKRSWLADRFKEGHVFRKLDEQGKVFIEYAPLDTAWVPVEGKNFMYIYCLWVSGKFKKSGHGAELLNYAISDSKNKGFDGICTISSDKKKPFLSDPKFLKKYGFKVVDSLEEYSLLSLNFNDNEISPKFTVANIYDEKGIHVFYTPQCPYISNCIKEMLEVDESLILHKIESLEEAKACPVLINNFAVIKNGKYITHELVNKNRFIKFIGE